MLRFKQLRLEKCLTQAEVAKVLGITQQAYANYERGVREADYSSLEKLAAFFEVSTDYLLGVPENEKKNSPPISEDKQKLLELYDLLTDREQGEIMGELKERTKDRGFEKEQVV